MLSALFCLAGPVPTPADGWIRLMEQTYAHLKTYRDTGIEHSPMGELTFETAYKAPGRMYFRYTIDGRSDYFCSNGSMGFAPAHAEFGSKRGTEPTWMADAFINRKHERDTLEMTIAGFTGISGGTAYNVPTMIFPLAEGRRFDQMKQPSIVGQDTVNGHLCVIVKAEDTKLWIGKKDFALYKMVESGQYGDTIVYKPILNGKVPDTLFVFK